MLFPFLGQRGPGDGLRCVCAVALVTTVVVKARGAGAAYSPPHRAQGETDPEIRLVNIEHHQLAAVIRQIAIQDSTTARVC